MARVRVRGKDPTTWFRQIRDRIENGNVEAVTEAMDEGASYMQYLIMSRGISPKTARYDTGKMVNSVTSRTTVSGKGTVQGQFGWREGDREDYFKFQEDGFTHAWSGKDVEGMYAMYDSAEYVFKELTAKIERNLRGA